MIWFVYGGILSILFYEFFAAISKRFPTISQLVWDWKDTHPRGRAWVVVGSIGGFISLMGHFFLDWWRG